MELKTFVLNQKDIDAAFAYHIKKGGNDHIFLASCLNSEKFYSYIYETVHKRVKPAPNFRKILKIVVDSLYCDRPQITIKTENNDDTNSFRIAECNGLL